MIVRFFLLICFLLNGSLLIISHWFGAKLSNLSPESILFHIFLPLDETLSINGNVYQIFYSILGYSVVLIISHFFIGLRYIKMQIFLLIALFVYNSYYIETRFHFYRYYRESLEETSFIRDHYVEPLATNISFPKNKRNLIIIQIESLETTLQDKKTGGLFDENFIPEITKIAQKHVSFTGMRTFESTNWTFSAVTAMETGLPLKLREFNLFELQRHQKKRLIHVFAVTLNDILYRAGYYNLFLLGTNPYFAGQKEFFEHHNTTVHSLYKNHLFDLKTDEKKDVYNAYDREVFSEAQNLLKDLKKPFSLFIQTYDTHEEGHPKVDPTCSFHKKEKILDSYRCVSQNLDNFMIWLQKQRFYKNTTILIVGDHENKSNKLCKFVSCKNYVRSPMVIFVNLPFHFQKQNVREFSAFDLFPTILYSIGVKIAQDKLGLGVNLFSNQQTILEKKSYNQVRKLLRQNDKWYNRKFLMNM